MVGILKSTVRRMLKQANLEREWWSYACRFAGHMMREKVLGRQSSLDDRSSVEYLLDIDIGSIVQDGIVVKCLAPRLLDPCRYHINPRTDLSQLEEGMPWRTIKDEFGKFKWIDHEGRVYQGTPYARRT